MKNISLQSTILPKLDTFMSNMYLQTENVSWVQVDTFAFYLTESNIECTVVPTKVLRTYVMFAQKVKNSKKL